MPTPDPALAAENERHAKAETELAAMREKLAKLERKLEIYRLGAHESGHLFCWCVENLPKFPPMEGQWIDDVKRRLQAAAAPASPPQAETAKTPVQWFTSGPLRYACDCGWHSAKGEAFAAQACYEAAMSESTQPSPAAVDVDEVAGKIADKIIWQWLFEENRSATLKLTQGQLPLASFEIQSAMVRAKNYIAGILREELKGH